MNAAHPATAGGQRVGHYRPHTKPGRPRQVRLRYTDEEYAAVERAAYAAGLTPTGYVAEAALAAAASVEPPRFTPWRSTLVELMDARNQVRRIGVNINQVARALNATGEPPTWIEHALEMTSRSLRRVDDAAATVSALAKRDSAARSRARRPPTPRLPE